MFVSFRCMLGGSSVELSANYILDQFIEGQTCVECQEVLQ